MARKQFPDHEGRMPDHPRYGNPSDPAEEAERIDKAYQNAVDWQKKYGGEFSGGVSMSYGNGPVYNVPIGNPEIAQKIVSRALPPVPEKVLIEAADVAPEPPPFTPPPPPRQSWIVRLFKRIIGAFR